MEKMEVKKEEQKKRGVGIRGGERRKRRNSCKRAGWSAEICARGSRGPRNYCHKVNWQSTCGCGIFPTALRDLVKRRSLWSRPASWARTSLRRTGGLEEAGLRWEGVEEAVLVCSAPPLALPLIYWRQWLDRRGVTNAWLKPGAAGVNHLGVGGTRYRGRAVLWRAGYL